MQYRNSLLAMVVCFVSFTRVLAQPGASLQPGNVTVTGTAELTKAPEVLRLYFKQYGKGSDQESAKAALVSAEKKLMTKLEAAGAEVIVAHAGVSTSSQNLLNRFRNMSNLMMQRQMANGGPNVAQVDKNTYLERFLTVDLRPKSKSKETMALLGELQERLRKEHLDLSGMNDAMPKDDNNDNNRIEFNSYRNDTSLLANDIRFQLAAKITRVDRIKLYADAMKRARTMAEDLAEAADLKVGSIQTLTSSFNTSYNVNNYSNFPRGVNANGEAIKFPISIKDDGTESIAVREISTNTYGSSAEQLTYSISLSVGFKLESAK